MSTAISYQSLLPFARRLVGLFWLVNTWCTVCAQGRLDQSTISIRTNDAMTFPTARIKATSAYNAAVTRLMISEVNRIAVDLKLAEKVPIDESVIRVFAYPPTVYIHGLELGTLDTDNYAYFFSSGNCVTGLDHKHISETWDRIRARYVWPIDKLDTNKALTLGIQIMERAGVNVEALKTDCTVEISAATFEGLKGEHFIPVYTLKWNTFGTNELFRDLPDQEFAAFKRRYTHKEAAYLRFLEPTRSVEALHVADAKYVVRAMTNAFDLFKLLTPENSMETLLREYEISTNAIARRAFFGKSIDRRDNDQTNVDRDSESDPTIRSNQPR